MASERSNASPPDRLGLYPIPRRAGLKHARRRADPRPMQRNAPELACPICNADLPLAGDERLGENVFCTYCGAPSILVGKDPNDPSDWDVEEDL
jgi:hypothetical protein